MLNDPCFCNSCDDARAEAAARQGAQPSGADPSANKPALPPNPKEAYGTTKPDLSLIPPVALHHMAMAFENGAVKYGPFNWRERGVQARTYVAAAMRHLCDWLDGQEVSLDTGIVHNLGHALASIGILLDCQAQGNLIDNRPVRGKSSEVEEALKKAKIAKAAEKIIFVQDGTGGRTIQFDTQLTIAAKESEKP